MSDRPAAEGTVPGAFPASPVMPGHIESVPRRVRAVIDDHTVVDTTAALYVWEHPYYPQFYVPAADVDTTRVRHTGVPDDSRQPGAEAIEVIGAGGSTAAAGVHVPAGATGPLADTYRFTWSAFDQWFEEDEQVYGHPRSPFVRVDALRSSRPVHVHVDGLTLAETVAPVAVFETGLPPVWYIARTDVRWVHLVPIDLRTLCPYKGRTTGYWSIQTGDRLIEEAAWSYEFPMRDLLPITGLVAFDARKVTVDVG